MHQWGGAKVVLSVYACPPFHKQCGRRNAIFNDYVMKWRLSGAGAVMKIVGVFRQQSFGHRRISQRVKKLSVLFVVFDLSRRHAFTLSFYGTRATVAAYPHAPDQKQGGGIWCGVVP